MAFAAEQELEQLCQDFRRSRVARDHWLARWTRRRIVASALTYVAQLNETKYKHKYLLARDLLVFLEENFAELATKESKEREKELLYMVCETLNSVIVSNSSSSSSSSSSSAATASQRLRCQALSSLTIILLTCNAYVNYRKILSSFVTLLAGIVARVRSHVDRHLRLVACESLRLLEYEYPDATFVVPKHILSHCEQETTHALQGYLGLLAASMCKLVTKVGDRNSHHAGGGKVMEAQETLSYHKNEIRQAALLLLDKLELLSPAGRIAITRDFLVLSTSAQIDHQDLWHNFYSLLHMSDPLLLSEVLLFCDQVDYPVSESDYYDVAYALIRRGDHQGLEPIQVCQLLGSALALPHSNTNVARILSQSPETLLPSPEDDEMVLSAKLYVCLTVCRDCSLSSGTFSAAGAGDQGANSSELYRRLELEVDLLISKGDKTLVEPLFSVSKRFLNEEPGTASVDLARRIMELCFHKHPKVFSSCLDAYLKKIGKADEEVPEYQKFLEAVVSLFSRWIPDDYKFVGKDMHLLQYYFSCMERLFRFSSIAPNLLLSVLLFYVRCCIPNQGERNWQILETVLSLIRSVFKHHATNIHNFFEVINDLLHAVKDLANYPDTVDHCHFYLRLINSIDATKLCLLMFHKDASSPKGVGEEKFGVEKPRKLPRKRNLFGAGSPLSFGYDFSLCSLRHITDFHIEIQELLFSEREFACKMRFVFDKFDACDGGDQMFAVEVSFEAEGSGDIAFVTRDILVPYVSSDNSGEVSFGFRFTVARPLPTSLLPKVKWTGSDGRMYSGRCKEILISFADLCVPYASGISWHDLGGSFDFGRGKHWIKTVKTVKLSETGLWKKFQIHTGDPQAITLAIFLPPQYHIIIVISSDKARISTDFWPCLEYMDDYLEVLFN